MNEFDIITQRVLAGHIKQLEEAYRKALDELAVFKKKIASLEKDAQTRK